MKSLAFPSGRGAVMKARRLNLKIVSEGGVLFGFQHKQQFSYNYSTFRTLQIPTLSNKQCMNCCSFGKLSVDQSLDAIVVHSLTMVIHVLLLKSSYRVCVAQQSILQLTKLVLGKAIKIIGSFLSFSQQFNNPVLI